VTDALLQTVTARGSTRTPCARDGGVQSPAIIIIAIITTLLVIGIKESANVNNVIVFVKVAVVLLFIIGCRACGQPGQLAPVHPSKHGVRGEFGWSGVMDGGGDRVLRLHRVRRGEHRGPGGEEPAERHAGGIIGSLLICTALLHPRLGIATGVISYKELNVPDPIAVAADRAGLGWMASLIKWARSPGFLPSSW